MSFLDLYREYAEQVTDAPHEYHIFLSLATAAVAIGNNRYMREGYKKLYPNMFLMIIGPSAIFRKSTSIGISRKLMFEINSTKVYPSDFSHEKMLDILKDNPVGAFYYYEFKALAEMLNKSYMKGAKTFFNDLYDCESTSKARKSEIVIIENPCGSLITGTTPDWFTSSIQEGDIKGGFLSRFIYVSAKKKLREDSRAKRGDEELWERIKNNLHNLEKLNSEEMDFSPKASIQYDKFYYSYIQEYHNTSPEYQAIINRIPSYLMKFAMVIETCETSRQEISEESTMKAIQLVKWLMKTTKEFYAQEVSVDKFDHDSKKILKIIKSHISIPRSDLMRLSNMILIHFNKIMETLLEGERIVCVHRKRNESNKLSKFYQLTGTNIEQEEEQEQEQEEEGGY